MSPEDQEDDESQGDSHPIAGNLWMIQCKREKEIGPKKLEQYLEEIKSAGPPYGYILAAPSNFSKSRSEKFLSLRNRMCSLLGA